MERIRNILLCSILPALFTLFIWFYIEANSSDISNALRWIEFINILIFTVAFGIGVYIEIYMFLENNKKNNN